MRKSFKARLFVHVILISAVVIFTNRLMGQYFLTNQLETRVHQEMGVALKTCGSHIERRNEFLGCFKALEKGGLFSNISDFYVLCDRAKLGTPAGANGANGTCQSLLATDDFWSDKSALSHDGVELSHGEVNQEVWYAARLSDRSQGFEVWLEGRQIDALMKRVWALRDRNTIYVLPTILIMLVALTYYLTSVMMRPITSIQNNISKLTASTLDQSIVLQAPYKEFEQLVLVFDELRIRLNDSFVKARRFASDASHELRTPLTILRGNVERFIHELPTGSETQVRMRNMGDEVERLIEITEKLLLLSRADANSLARAYTEVDFSQMITQLIASDEGDMKPRFKLTSAIEPGVRWLCDKTLAMQLVHNLYENAQKYNRPKGWIHFSLTQNSGQFRLTVENTCANIPTDLSQRAFERFYRGDASHTRQIDGLGLGLSICSEIAKIHHGALSLSVTDKSTVLLTLTAPLNSASG
jgi:signal transduction histidine kinase